MSAVTTTGATTHSRALVLTAGKGQRQLLQFVFDDTSFTFEDSSTSTWASHSDYFVLTSSFTLTPQAHLAFMFP